MLKITIYPLQNADCFWLPCLLSRRPHVMRTLRFLVPVRALRIYIDRSASFRQSDQLSCVLRWLCEGPYQNRGFPLDCGRYQGCLYEPRLECPFHIRVYLTRVIAFCAWLRGMSIQDIYFAAGWSSQNTFARFYKLDGQSFAS